MLLVERGNILTGDEPHDLRRRGQAVPKRHLQALLDNFKSEATREMLK
jgi:hypothetical protein